MGEPTYRVCYGLWPKEIKATEELHDIEKARRISARMNAEHLSHLAEAVVLAWIVKYQDGKAEIVE